MTEQTFTRGGYPLSGDPTMTRHGHVGPDRPRCAVCNGTIFGDEDYLPNKCHDGTPHTYPNGEKCPGLYYTYPGAPDGHYLFWARSLTSKDGFDTANDQPAPEEVANLVIGGIHPDTWALFVVRPVVQHLLLPLLPFEHTVAEHRNDNPIRLTHIQGRDVKTIGAYELSALLDQHHLALPYSTLARLAAEGERLWEHGVPTEAVVLATVAGLTEAEITARHDTGALDAADLRVLAGLRA